MKCRETSCSNTILELSHKLTHAIIGYLESCISLIISYDFCLSIIIYLLLFAKKKKIKNINIFHILVRINFFLCFVCFVFFCLFVFFVRNMLLETIPKYLFELLLSHLLVGNVLIHV